MKILKEKKCFIECGESGSINCRNSMILKKKNFWIGLNGLLRVHRLTVGFFNCIDC